MLLGVDVGGTFTDAVAFGGDEIHSAKVPTTPGREAEGVVQAIEKVLEASKADPRDVARFVHGMTVGTNALLEERGARTALIATRGFADVIDVARQARPSLYRLCEPKPAPLVAPQDRFEVDERTGPDGVIHALTDGDAERVAGEVTRAGVESVAISLLFSYLEPAHEQRIRDAIRKLAPDLHVSASHRVLPRFREYERTSTTVIDAYLSPLIGGYLTELAGAVAARGVPEPDVMRSSGGIAPWREAAREGAWSVLSGPAGGAVGAGLIAKASANGNAVGLDMGGTSCDVCLVEDGRVRTTESREIGGRTIQLPMVDVHTVGAGGGSIAWCDHGGALRVGPRSAGAEPGPACYGRGGTEATVTDANLVLGRLAPDSGLAGGVALDPDAAVKAIDALAAKVGLDRTGAAEGILRLANAEMTRALRVVTVERGIDPREFALLPFGGAGPMHAAELAAELGMRRIACPRAGGVLSALGLLASPRRRDIARTVMLSGPDLGAARIAAEVASLRKSLEAGMEGARADARFELRYAGQAFELEIPGDEEPDLDELIGRFATEHERRYGFRDDGRAVELVAIGLSLTVDADPPTPRAATDASQRRSTRKVLFASEWVEADVISGELAEGEEAQGPAILELPESTLVLPPAWSACVDEHGTVLAEADA